LRKLSIISYLDLITFLFLGNFKVSRKFSAFGICLLAIFAYLILLMITYFEFYSIDLLASDTSSLNRALRLFLMALSERGL